MRRFVGLCSVAALTLAVVGPAPAAEKLTPTFGTLSAPSEVSVRVKAAEWLKGQGAYNRTAFDAIWSKKEPLLDRLSATLRWATRQRPTF